MPATRKPSSNLATAHKRAARKAEDVANLLHSFAATLSSLDTFSSPSPKSTATPRNWWKLQAGRFKDDPTFPDFVSQVQAARKLEG